MLEADALAAALTAGTRTVLIARAALPSKTVEPL